MRSRATVFVSLLVVANYDGSKIKQPALAKRKPGDPNPYLIGNDGVRRYLKVAEECATAALRRLK